MPGKSLAGTLGITPQSHSVPLWWHPLLKAWLGMKSKVPEHELIGDFPMHLKTSEVRITTVFPPGWSSCAPSYGQWLNLITRTVIMTSLSSLLPCGLGSYQKHWHRVTETSGVKAKPSRGFVQANMLRIRVMFAIVWLCYCLWIWTCIIHFLSFWTLRIFERKFLLLLVPRCWVALPLISNNTFLLLL